MEAKFLAVDLSLQENLFMAWTEATFSLTATLKPELWTFERHVYRVLELIGNVGGLADGLKLMFSLVVVYYNSVFMERALAGHLFKA